MKKTTAKTIDIIINYVQLNSDGKIALSVFLAKVESKNRTEVITKDMWYKLHPLPYLLFKKTTLPVCGQYLSFCPRRRIRRVRQVNRKTFLLRGRKTPH